MDICYKLISSILAVTLLLTLLLNSFRITLPSIHMSSTLTAEQQFNMRKASIAANFVRIIKDPEAINEIEEFVGTQLENIDYTDMDMVMQMSKNVYDMYCNNLYNKFIDRCASETNQPPYYFIDCMIDGSCPCEESEPWYNNGWSSCKCNSIHQTLVEKCNMDPTTEIPFPCPEEQARCGPRLYQPPEIPMPGCIDLTGKVVLISGGSSGIGNATAHYLASLGAVVYGTSRWPGEYIPPTGWQLIEGDVRNLTSMQAAVNYIVYDEGHPHIDLVYANAGTHGHGKLIDSSTEAYKQMFDTNLFGVHNTWLAVRDYMPKTGFARFIVTGSLGAVTAYPYHVGYSSTKRALQWLILDYVVEKRYTPAYTNVFFSMIEFDFVATRIGDPYFGTVVLGEDFPNPSPDPISNVVHWGILGPGNPYVYLERMFGGPPLCSAEHMHAVACDPYPKIMYHGNCNTHPYVDDSYVWWDLGYNNYPETTVAYTHGWLYNFLNPPT